MFDKLKDMPFLVSRFTAEIRSSNGAILIQNFHFIVYIVCLVAYTLSPLDLLPELVFGAIGLIDDVIVVVYILVAISSVFYQFLVERNQREVRA